VSNDGDEPLRYVALSTMDEPDVTVYLDSDKVGIYAGLAPGSDDERVVGGSYRRDDDVDYWLDEARRAERAARIASTDVRSRSGASYVESASRTRSRSVAPRAVHDSIRSRTVRARSGVSPAATTRST
jgi:hypothetical protein